MLLIIGALGVELPLFGVECVACNQGDPCLQFDLLRCHQGVCPSAGQSFHAGGGDPMGFAGGAIRLGDAPHFIQDSNGGGAPALADTGYGVQGLLKASVSHGEILRPMVKGTKGAVTRSHASSHPPALFK